MNDTRVSTLGGASRSAAIRQVISDYVELTKPKVQSLLLLTTVATMEVAGNPPVSKVALTCVGGYLAAGGAGAVNHYYDRDIDARMARTANRPVPAGRVSPRAALIFGFALAAASFVLMALTLNLLAASLAFAGFVGYAGIYTVALKRHTPQNIVLGGAAGAVPPLVAWAATTGSVSWMAIYLFAIVFYWTPPHFWALSLLMKKEYAEVGVPMMPVARGERETRRLIVLYSAADLRGDAAAVLRRLARRHLPRGIDASRRGLHRVRDRPLPSRGPPLRPASVPVLARISRAAVRRDGRRRQTLTHARISRMDRKLARKNIRAGLVAGAICAFTFGITFVVAAIYIHS